MYSRINRWENICLETYSVKGEQFIEIKKREE